jgi:hypothetical protein
MNGEYLLSVSPLIAATVQSLVHEFAEARGDDPSDYETDAYHFVHRLDDWLEENREFVEYHILDPDLIARQWLHEQGKRMIRERIQYLG